jgi:biopolymer transport protein ExbD
MSWKLRHQGSPDSLEGLTFAQVLEGLLDGQWEPTDEVMGPEDRDWVAIENHPELAELAADLEPPPRKGYDDETRLDMNALIDVCLVLLIFFIVTTTFGLWVQKVVDAANLTADDATGALVVTEEQVEDAMIRVKVTRQGEESVIEVEGRRVNQEDLVPVFSQFVRDDSKLIVLIDAGGDVRRETVIAIQDAAKGAGVDKVFRLAPRPAAPEPAPPPPDSGG